jgi:hypothetical protein
MWKWSGGHLCFCLAQFAILCALFGVYLALGRRCQALIVGGPDTEQLAVYQSSPYRTRRVRYQSKIHS